MSEREYYLEKMSRIGIPQYMRDGLDRWIWGGIRPGHFLTALLSNDLMETMGRADDVNIMCLKSYAIFLYSYAPRGCYGSAEAVEEWAKDGGLVGREMKHQQEEVANEAS